MYPYYTDPQIIPSISLAYQISRIVGLSLFYLFSYWKLLSFHSSPHPPPSKTIFYYHLQPGSPSFQTTHLLLLYSDVHIFKTFFPLYKFKFIFLPRSLSFFLQQLVPSLLHLNFINLPLPLSGLAPDLYRVTHFSCTIKHFSLHLLPHLLDNTVFISSIIIHVLLFSHRATHYSSSPIQLLPFSTIFTLVSG